MKHKGRIFHVQTEDSGVSRPHIVTHLFADGGRILKSTRTDYSEHLGRADMGTVVRGLMKEQHKAMFIALRDGQLDATIDGLLGPIVSTAERHDTPPAMSIPLSVATRAATIPDPSLGASSASLPKTSKAEAAAPSSKAAPTPQTLTDLVLADLASSRSPNPPGISAKPPPKPIARGATPALGSPSVPPQRATTPSMPAQRGTTASVPPQRGTAASRYAAARPAAIFSPNPEHRSLFGGASISEQSLDEVILSYLAEDLDGTPDK